ncbi:MAG TPA: metallophosphoesterase, partial [Acidimicrobiales bacterium]|nr:metallophosphoesterase [Acidimicrobiales bacterium]
MTDTAAAVPTPAAVKTPEQSGNGAGPPPETVPAVPDVTEVAVPPGGRTVVVSDLHLPTFATETSRAVEAELSEVLDQWVGPGVFVIAGDGLELLAGPPDVSRILDAHPRFAQALGAFAGTVERTLVVLPGNHDGRLAWDREALAVLRERVGAYTIALAVDLLVPTEGSTARVRVVHGNQLDPYNAFEDPRSPVDTPMGHHIVQQILPELEARQEPGSLLDGVQWLDGDLADFVGSRLLYRKVVGKLWLIAIPFLAALVLRFLAFFPGVGALLHHHAQRWLVGLGVLIALMVVVAAVAALATMLRVNRALRESVVSMRADPATHNSAARSEASRLVTEGYAGVVSGHTHEPELSVVGNGFYANSGSG